MKYIIRKRYGLWMLYYGDQFISQFNYYKNIYPFIRRREARLKAKRAKDALQNR